MIRRLFVLSGGGGAGVVKHAAMCYALWNHDIRPTAVSGTSAGGLVALALATGTTPHALYTYLHGVGPRGVLAKRTAWLARFRWLESIHADRAARRVIGGLIPEGREALRIPAHVWAVDEESGTLLDVAAPEQGLTLQEAALATMSAPPMLPAVRAGDRRLVDGGVAYNVPLIHGWEAYDEVYLLIACDRLSAYRRRDILSRTVRAVQLMMAAQVDEVLNHPLARNMMRLGKLRVLWPDMPSQTGLLDLDLHLFQPTLLWALDEVDRMLATEPALSYQGGWSTPVDLRAAD